MQQINFCGLNDAAAERVKQEGEAAERKKLQESRRASEKAGHRASMLLPKGDDKLRAEIAKKREIIVAEEKAAGVVEEPDVDDDDPNHMKEYDKATDGLYSKFYFTFQKEWLDEQRKEWRSRSEKKE